MPEQADAGVIGLGIMGSAMAGNLLAAGMAAAGHDPDTGARQAIVARGGQAFSNAADVASAAPVVLLSLPSPEALDAVVADLADRPPPGRILVETSTLAIDDKIRARDARLNSHRRAPAR